MSSSPANDPVASRLRKTKLRDGLLNVMLFLTVGLCVAVLVFPIFSHELYAASRTYDFGTVKQGTRVQHNFTLRNLHPWTVTVTGVESSCGCTKAFVGERVPFQLRPLQSVQIDTSVNTTHKANNTREAVLVFTNDNANGTPLIVQGRVQEDRQKHKEL